MPSNCLLLCHPFSSWPQSFPALGSFPVSQLFTSGGQSIGASASASVFPVNIQGWFPLGQTGLISLFSKGLSRVFSNTSVWNHHFFGAQPSLWCNCHICTWLPEKPCPFHYRGLECKSRKSRNTWSNRQIWPWSTEWSRAKANRVLPRERTGHSKRPLPTTQEKTLHMDITRWSTLKSDWLYSL